MTEETKYELRFTNRFKKHLKRVEKRNPKNIKKIHETINLLQKGESLPDRFCDHELTGNFAGHRECHVLPDLLLIYKIYKNLLILELADTGTHSDLFGK